MNKYKKLAIAAVSMVMAGTMVFSFAACGGDSSTPGGPSNPSGADVERSTELHETTHNAAASAITSKSVGGKNISVLTADQTKLAYPVGTTVVSNIIDSGNADRHISYDESQIAGKWKALDGYTYYSGDLKPAWWQLGQNLGIKFTDNAKSGRSGTELETVANNSEWAQYNLINSSVGAISKYQSNLLDLSPYLDYMPNFKYFLEQHPIVQWSLTMTTDGAIYYIPYFDGNDDIEKYELVQRNWVEILLDDALPATDTSITYKEQLTAKGINTVATSIEQFMGTTGSWEVDTTDPTKAEDLGGALIKLKVNYGDVITKLGDTNSDLYKAVKAAIGDKTPQTTSGNIIDIQNDLITQTAGEVKGSDLVKVLREYIKVAYQKADGSAFYTKLSDVFNSSYAGWDVDLMNALYRCVVTNFKSFPGMSEAKAKDVYALAGREMKAQRVNDIIAYAGEAYGVRGMESRQDYTYIDSKGTLQDARMSEESYEAAAKLNNLTKEGLLFTEMKSKSETMAKKYKADTPVTFMLHDYVQTQTTDGFAKDGTAAADFDFAPIVTPVSYWDTNDDGSKDTYMRFTESWRSVKNSGVVVPSASVSDPNKLSAVLSFIDYLFSNDGQIIGSYGPMSTKGNVADADGFWYGKNGKELLDAEGHVKSEYTDKVETKDGVQYFLKDEYKGTGFTYDNVLYEGLPYNGRQIPIMTDNNMNFYLGLEVNGGKMDTANTVGYKKNHQYKYTDYARGVVGAALPIGNKDQGFEYQCTAECGLDGAAVVNVALQNGAIKHVVQTVSPETWWYTVAPTCLPTTAQEASTIGKQTFLDGSSKAVGIFNPTSTAGYTNVYIDLAFYGYNTSIKIGTVGKTDGDYAMQANASALLNYIKSQGGEAGLAYRITAYQTAWTALKTKYQVGV